MRDALADRFRPRRREAGYLVISTDKGAGVAAAPELASAARIPWRVVSSVRDLTAGRAPHHHWLRSGAWPHLRLIPMTAASIRAWIIESGS